MLSASRSLKLRYAEFGSACIERSLKGEKPSTIYYGLLREGQKDIIATLESDVFKHWDGLGSSPPKTRPRSEVCINITGLALLTCDAAGNPGWPPHLSDKFPAESMQGKRLQELKANCEKEFPAAAVTTQTSRGRAPTRASGDCDFSVNNGEAPLDLERVLDLPKIAAPEPDMRTSSHSLVSKVSTSKLLNVNILCLFHKWAFGQECHYHRQGWQSEPDPDQGIPHHYWE